MKLLREIIKCNPFKSGIPRCMTAKDSLNIERIDSKLWLQYLEQICEVFRGEIPHVKHPKLDFAELKQKTQSSIRSHSNNMAQFTRMHNFVTAKNKHIPINEAVNNNLPTKIKADVATSNTAQAVDILIDDDLQRRRARRTSNAENNPSVLPSNLQQQDVPQRRAKKRRSYEKYGNIVSIVVKLFYVLLFISCLYYIKFNN